MRITYKGDYALKAVLALSYHFESDVLLSVSDIAKGNDIPVSFLEQIMLTLRRAGYIESKRGKGGGFYLLRSPEKITMGEIVRLMEGPIEPIACVNPKTEDTCVEGPACAFKEVWCKVTKAISSVVDHVTFADIMCRTEELKQKRQDYDFQI